MKILLQSSTIWYIYQARFKVWSISQGMAIRFKVKHQQFKLIPKTMKNFCNLPKTLAESHQSEVREDSISVSAGDNPIDHPLFGKDFVYSRSSSHVRVFGQHDKDTAKDCILRFYPSFEDDSDKPISKASCVTVHGTCYKKGNNTMLLAEISNCNPIFGSLENIWLCDSLVFLSLKLYETVGFEQNLLPYQTKEEELPSGLFVVEVQDLPMPCVMHTYKYNDCLHLSKGGSKSTYK